MEKVRFCFSFFILLTSVKLSFAADNISPGILFRDDGETLISSAERFELGFFSPVNSKNRYLGIWYKKSPDKVVWVANRNNPILNENGVLVIGNNGNLFLNETNGIVWSSNISIKVENPVAQLLDTGNFVLRDNFSRNNSENYLWQSFDYPSDTLLPGMKLGWNLKTGVERYLTSWRSVDDPSSGDFTLRFDISLLPELVIYNGSIKIARTGAWNGVFFGGIPPDQTLLSQMIMVQNEDEYSYRYDNLNNEMAVVVNLNQSGSTEWKIWNQRSIGWDLVYSAPEDLCGQYWHCGNNSICNINKTTICECLRGFISNSQHKQTSSRGCVRSSPLDCEGGDRFIKLDGIKLPDLIDVSVNESMSLKQCETKCLNNCSCKAYANSNVTGGGSGCLMWFGDLIDIRKLVENRGTQDLYIRVPASELESNRSSIDVVWIIVITITSLTMVILVFIIIFYVRRNHRTKGKDLMLFDIGMGVHQERNKKEVELPLFSFSSVSAATENFSATNKLGEGGFGPVYKGTLLKGDEIAVKRLSKRSGQGWDELKNEAILIAKLQHKNLVRVLGCCIEHNEKILIFEYMPNKSLDIFLFDPTKRMLLDWKMRVRIIKGIAQGLLYLHEYSTVRIIHRDLKASNILLDEHMNPKISDFGVARIFSGNELEGFTNQIIGTHGYMSPEYALEGIFSIKSDVFSFGVLLLEIVSGKKNTGFYQTNSLNLLRYAWDMWRSDRGLDLMDPVLEEEASSNSKHILLRYVNIALLCVQESAEDRPAMSDVISMLMNNTGILPPPKPSTFSNEKITANSESFISRRKNCSVNNVAVTI